MKRFFFLMTLFIVCASSITAQKNCTKTYTCYRRIDVNTGIEQVPSYSHEPVIFYDNGKKFMMGDGTCWQYVGNGNNCRNFKYIGNEFGREMPMQSWQYAQVSLDYTIIYKYCLFGMPGMFSQIRDEYYFVGNGIVQ